VRFLRFVGLLSLGVCAAGIGARAESLPQLVQGKSGRTLLVDGKPYFVLGAQVHNSSGWPATLESAWPDLERIHANTIMVPAYWEAVEPARGQFDFANIDAAIDGARQHGLRIALLWFGTWKNGGMAYVPAWVKENPQEYPPMLDENGNAINALSPLSETNLAADRDAFAALMRHLRDKDGERHTVIMVQVENEAGSLGSDRDYSKAANSAFQNGVPDIVVTSLKKQHGSWQQVFGADAPEAFSAYYVARYIGQVAEAGKRAYPLPTYVNVWPREQPGLLRPGFSSPSGGAVSWLLDMWKQVAPAVDVIGPDNYDTNFMLFRMICDRYARADNPLLIPETGTSPAHARHAFYAIADYNSIGISVFGVDGNAPRGKAVDRESETAINYRLIGAVIPQLLSMRDEGHLHAAVEEDGIANPQMLFDNYDAVARFGTVSNVYGGDRGAGNPEIDGRVLVGQLGTDEFLVLGSHANVVFQPKLGDTKKQAVVVSVEEGSYENGVWKRTRLLNGDETYFGLILPREGAMLRVKLMRR